MLEAANATEAISIMESADRVELMFTDIRVLGGMDGLELAAFIHAHWPDVQLLVTSGNIVLADREIPDGVRFASKPYYLARVVPEIRVGIAVPSATD